MGRPSSISVAIPSYNRAAALETLLGAVVEQLGADDELLVVDDGSNDDSAARARRFARCRVIRHERNRGMVPAWNACLEASTRDWVCLVHNDDRLVPGGLDALRRAIALAPHAGLVAHKHAPSEAGGWCAEVWDAGPDAVLASGVIPSGAAVSRTALQAVGGFDERFAYSTDIEYFARITARFEMVLVRSPQVVEYRLHDANHQYATWRKPDFFDQLEALEDAVLRHTGVTDERREIWRQARWTAYLVYMLKVASRLGDRALMRTIGARLAQRRNVGRKMRALASIAAEVGWCPPVRALRL